MNTGLNKSVWGIWISQVKMTEMQLEIQFSGLKTSVNQTTLWLSTEWREKEQSAAEHQCLGVRNRERCPGAERAKGWDTSRAREGESRKKERASGNQCQTDKKRTIRPQKNNSEVRGDCSLSSHWLSWREPARTPNYSCIHCPPCLAMSIVRQGLRVCPLEPDGH